MPSYENGERRYQLRNGTIVRGTEQEKSVGNVAIEFEDGSKVLVISRSVITNSGRSRTFFNMMNSFEELDGWQTCLFC